VPGTATLRHHTETARPAEFRNTFCLGLASPTRSLSFTASITLWKSMQSPAPDLIGRHLFGR
jgi:hypothetical protein